MLMNNEICEDSPELNNPREIKNRELQSVSLSDRVEKSLLIKFTGMNDSQH